MRLAVLCALVVVASAPGAVARPSAGPTNTAAPTIVGVPRVNGSVSSAPGTWTTAAGTITYAYAWQQCDPAGASCSPLPYTTPSIQTLPPIAGKTLRVLVTASDSTGSAQAVSAPVLVQAAGGGTSKKLAVSIVSPKPGSTVTTRRFTLVVKAAGPGTLRVTVEGMNLPSRSKRGPAGLFRFPITYPDARRAQFDAVVTDSRENSKEKDFVLIIQPPMRVIQESGDHLIAPGCRTCVIRDPAGDDLGSPPDIKTATSTFAGGWIVHTVTTYGPVRGVRTPCITGFALFGPKWSGFSVGCAAGIIEGSVCGHACGAVQTSYPDSHTVRYRFRPAQIGNPPAYLWDVWVLYHGDNLKDAAPSLSGRLPEPNASWHYCLVREQLRAQIPDGVYRFGRGVCSQSAVVSGKP